jgi:pimeloyl-ACP methyl ester carboxylesterase
MTKTIAPSSLFLHHCLVMSRVLLLFVTIALLRADGPADNLADKVRPVPPPGVAIADSDRSELKRGTDELRAKIASLESNTNAAGLVPDIQIFFNAVDYALRYNEFLNGTNDVRAAKKILADGHQRADELAAGKPSWINAPGLIVRGYLSRIDGSVQPYGLVVPPSLPNSPERLRRLDAWFHGRDEKLTELKFLTDRQRSAGEFVPPDAFVLHLYGRYCNANKFAGEIDLFEALADVKKRYRIDEDRIVIRGFSMGGAACWQFAVHYPGEFAAAAPGAGFAETKEFLRVFQNEAVAPPQWEQTLWHWYDCPDYAVNLFNLPTVAYSGEIDRQKQAADIMATALEREGIELTHIIGPNTPHRYHPDSKREINERIDAIAARGRDPLPRQVKFATYTLRYNKSHWISLDGLEEHWKCARIDAELTADGIQAATTNISALTFEISPGLAPFASAPKITIDGQTIPGKNIRSDRSWRTELRKRNGQWALRNPEGSETLRKKPGVQGPIDDAFMDSFIFVLPTRASGNERFDDWVQKEMARATGHWRKQFRGEVRAVRDSELTPELVKSSNLIFWGDPLSNPHLAKIASKLPITFSDTEITLGNQKFSRATHAPAFIYPNPENPDRYIVLNSGFTFREYDYLNNARQVAKLPDYAIIDITTSPNSRYPGKIVSAGFFDERWQLPKE